MPPLAATSAAPRALVTIVLPAKNEADAIGSTLQALPLRTLDVLGFDAEVIVLDGNSRDATARIAREFGAAVLEDARPGKGHAFRAARGHFRGEYVVMLDADGTYPPDAIPRMLDRVASGHAEIAMGERIPQPGSMPRINRVGNSALSWTASLLYGRHSGDVCTGLWAFRREALLMLPLESQTFGLEAELFALSARLRLRVAKVPVDYLPRRGVAKLHWARDGLRIARRLIRSRLMALKPRPVAPARDAPLPEITPEAPA